MERKKAETAIEHIQDQTVKEEDKGKKLDVMTGATRMANKILAPYQKHLVMECR